MSHRHQTWFRRTVNDLGMYNHLTAQIHSYELTIEEIQDEFVPTITQRYELREGNSYRVSNPVEDAVVKMECDPRIVELRKAIKQNRRDKLKIEYAMRSVLTAEQRRLIEATYFDLTDQKQEVYDALGMTKTTYYEHHGRCIKLLAGALGYLPIREKRRYWGMFAEG